MNRTMSLTGALVLMLSPLAANAFDEMNATLYMEAKAAVKLYSARQLPDGQRALVPAITLPSESIVSIPTTALEATLTAATSDIGRVDFPFVDSPTDARVQYSGKGWLCGLSIVDINDEDLRELTSIERSDFCLSLADLDRVDAMETNAEMVRNSYVAFARQGNLRDLESLSGYLRATESFGAKSAKKVAPAMISPIKNCGPGCLSASSEFGMRNHPVLKRKRLHKGIDLRAKSGTPVVSVLPGTILANRSERSRKGKLKGYGHYVIVVHPASDMKTLYAHLSAFKGKAGADVKAGDLVALSGNTGIGTGPHLHFETHVPNKKGVMAATNPRQFIGSILKGVAGLLRSLGFHV